MASLAVLLLMLPLTMGDGWEVLSYRGIPSHTVSFGDAGLRIDVNASAAPLIYPLSPVRRVSRLRVRGRVTGALRTTADEQGQPGADDYVLRVGLVEVGARQPGWLERRLAPEWLRRLFDLAPPGLGTAGIRFFNVGLSPDQIGDTRRHPSSDLITERIVTVPEEDGTIAMAVDLAAPIDASAVWIGADGDDTASRFSLLITRIELGLQR